MVAIVWCRVSSVQTEHDSLLLPRGLGPQRGA
jgi:hypothetical protein